MVIVVLEVSPTITVVFVLVNCL